MAALTTAPTFAIVTPCLNAYGFIRETIESVIYQRGEFHIDYLVVDGGSQDGTVRLLDEVRDRVQSARFEACNLGVRFRFMSEPDRGMYDALAKGMRNVDGDYFAYINADDIYLPNAFESVRSVFAEHAGVYWITGTSTWLNENGSIVRSLLPVPYRRSYIQRGIYGTLLPHVQQESTFWRSELNAELDASELAAWALEAGLRQALYRRLRPAVAGHGPGLFVATMIRDD